MNPRKSVVMEFSEPKGTLMAALFALVMGALTLPCHAALELPLADQALKACLQSLAAENGWSQAEQVTRLKCHSAGIKSVNGIEALPNLETLSLYNNELTQLDIDLKRFPKLSMLNLARNNIEALKLERLPSLQKIYLFDNGMKSLELSNLPTLAILKANNNRLERFSYADMPYLEKVYIFNNKLETINIYDLPKLQYMDCRQNPMPDELYDEMDRMETATFLHDGNADDWK